MPNQSLKHRPAASLESESTVVEVGLVDKLPHEEEGRLSDRADAVRREGVPPAGPRPVATMGDGRLI